MPAETDLAGITVLVTRPEHQARRLCELIEQAGGRAVRFPLIAIAAPDDPGPAMGIATQIDNYDIAIFVSTNAVDYGVDLIRRARGELPTRPRLAAIGAATAQRLETRWRRPDVVPAGGFDSETLLATDAMRHVRGRRIAIFRGSGGRELLGDTLRQRGAHVDYADVYRRLKPQGKTLPLLHDGARDNIDVIVVTSNEGIENLLELTSDAARPALLKLPLALMSRRGAELAATRGFIGPLLVAASATDEALVDAIRHWRSTTPATGKRT